MTDIREFDPVLPDPQFHIEKAIDLYKQVGQTGRVVFITAELGGGKTETLDALVKALHQSNPIATFLAGSFKGGEFIPQPLGWQPNMSYSKAILALGGLSSLVALGVIPIGYAFAAAFFGQLLVTSVEAYKFLLGLKKDPSRKIYDADWLTNLLHNATRERPLICMIDDWDEARDQFAWNSILISLSRQIAQGLPILLFIGLKGPINLDVSGTETDLTKVVRGLVGAGQAELWPLKKLSREDIATAIGHSSPDIAETLHGVTGSNARWVRELWREWRLDEIVVTDQTGKWIWGSKHEKATAYERNLIDRLARLLKTTQASEVEATREILACAALEGVHFTAEAVAEVLKWDRDELIDFLDETLVQTEDNPDGMLLEENSISLTMSDGTTRTLWRYTFVSDLQWMMLKRFGFANILRPQNGDTEKLERSASLARVLMKLYETDESLIAASLANLLRDLGSKDLARRYHRIAESSAHRTVMREQAFLLCSLNKHNWGRWEYARAVKFLNEAVKAMVKVFPNTETLAVAQEACELAVHAEDKSDEARALYFHALILFRTKEFQSARKLAKRSLGIHQLIRDKHKEASVLNLLAEIDNAENNYLGARRQVTAALKIEKMFDCRRGEGRGQFLLAKVDHDEGNHSEARRHAILALRAYQVIGDLWHVANTLLLLSDIAGHLQKPKTAFDLSALHDVIITEHKLIEGQDKSRKCGDLFTLQSDKELAQIRLQQLAVEYRRDGGEKIIKRMLENLGRKDDEQCDHTH